MCWNLQLQPLELQDGTGCKGSWWQYEGYFGYWKQLRHISRGAVQAFGVCCSADQARQGRALPCVQAPDAAPARGLLRELHCAPPQPSCPLPCISLGTLCSTSDWNKCCKRKAFSDNAVAHTHTQKREIFINNSGFIYTVSMDLLCQTPSVLSQRPSSLRCTYSQPLIFQRLRDCDFVHRLKKMQAWRNVTHRRWPFS